MDQGMINATIGMAVLASVMFAIGLWGALGSGKRTGTRSSSLKK